MNSTEALREFEKMWTPKKRGKGPSTFPQHLHALISEHYTEKAKYDELLWQRDELREQLRIISEAFWTDGEPYEDRIADLQIIAKTAICTHENEVMRQGDGSVYVTCKHCGKEL